MCFSPQQRDNAEAMMIISAKGNPLTTQCLAELLGGTLKSCRNSDGTKEKESRLFSPGESKGFSSGGDQVGCL